MLVFLSAELGNALIAAGLESGFRIEKCRVEEGYAPQVKSA